MSKLMIHFVTRRLGRIAVAAALLVGLHAQAAIAQATWTSGTRNNSNLESFVAWRETPLKVITGWIDWRNGWEGMYAFAGGRNPRTLHAKSPNVTLAHGLFPSGGDLKACARGEYDSQQRKVATLLRDNDAADDEIRLGWEANGDWFPWTAVGQPYAWKQCFTRIAKIMKEVSPSFRICWSMGKKGRIDVRTIWPTDPSPITNICLSHYDDAWDRLWDETYKGGPWGLRSWLDFARSKNRKIAFGEWGVGREGDNAQYIQDMHDFFVEAGSDLAHEAYNNSGKYQLYPVAGLPNSSAHYKQLF
jgi:hypothetical protein